MTKTRTALVAASLLTALGAAALLSPAAQGQQSPAAAGDDLLSGRPGTVEYRPLPAGNGQFIQKQRVGLIKKVTAEWVVLEENGAVVAVPRDMVLEIRLDKK